MAVQCVKCWRLVYAHETKVEPATPGGVESWTDHECVTPSMRNDLSKGDLNSIVSTLNREQALNGEIDCLMRTRLEGSETRWEPRYAEDANESSEDYVNRITAISLEERSCPYFAPHSYPMKLKDYLALEQKNAIEALVNRTKADLLRRKVLGLNDRVSAVRKLEPHKRGVEYRHLMKELFDAYGLQPRENISIAGEQIDLSFGSGGLVSAVAEIKWQAQPVSAGKIREFQGKLENRSPRIVGLYVSMSGFSAPAVDQASEGLQRRLTVLFETKEVEDIFTGKVDLVSLLHEKIRRAEEEKNPI